MEPHHVNSYLLILVAVLVGMALFAALMLLIQLPLERLKKRYFPGEQEYELIA
uniref:Potassium-transporting ATPase subunit KdpA n=1 Tax=Heterorhabditis bacteriophora TaxID=37862 RepID=A0A1I7XKR5_HETBA